MQRNSLINLVIGLLIFFGLLFLYTRLAGPIPFSVNSINTNKTDLFEASGTGKASAAPDKATVSVGVTESAPQVLDAQSRANTKAENIIEAIKRLGVEEKDIKTTNYSVNPDYTFGTTQRISGYTVTQNIEVQTSIDKINQVVDGATQAGANVAGNIQFTLSEEKLEELQNQAREEAVAAAKRKAEGLAKAAGINLGRIIDVNEVAGGGEPRPMFLEAKAADNAETVQPETNITPGENNVEVNITLVYQTN
jgi:uncharacterized protein